jgi:hypothetical protein
VQRRKGSQPGNGHTERDSKRKSSADDDVIWSREVGKALEGPARIGVVTEIQFEIARYRGNGREDERLPETGRSHGELDYGMARM